MTFGEYIKKLREQHRYTLRAVAKQMKTLPPEERVSAPYLSQVERGEMSPPQPAKLKGIAKVYHVDYEDLMRRAGHLPTEEELVRQEAASELTRLAQQLDRELTDEERESVIQFMLFVRARKREKERQPPDSVRDSDHSSLTY